jgi:N-formylmethionyl-tRNA deformylase
MPLLPIVRWPDPVLLTVAKPVADDEFGPDLERLASDMFQTMEDAGGVGLAASQVGVSKRLFVMDTPVEEEGSPRQRHGLVDPQIVRIEGEQVAEEGCLSFPGLFQVVKREMRVIARARASRVKNSSWTSPILRHAAFCMRPITATG